MGESERAATGGAEQAEGNHFRTTHWSLVLAAGGVPSGEAQQALAELYRLYWYPLYAFVRRQGHGPEEARDLAQEFFAQLIETNLLRDVDQAKGRFRSFLLACLRHFLANEWHKAGTVKRGGRFAFISWEQAQAEERFRQEPVERLTAEKIFDRRWALTLLDEVLRKLRQEYAEAGRSDLFEGLEIYLTGDSGLPSYAETATRLSLKPGTVNVTVHRLRRRYGELLRREIAQTVAGPEEIEDEIRALFAALG